MGQPISVIESRSRRTGAVRFETNRVISGMGHERFRAGQEIVGERPVDELARRLLAHGGVDQVHVLGSVVTVDVAKGGTTEGLREIVEGLYTYYGPGVPVPSVEEFTEA